MNGLYYIGLDVHKKHEALEDTLFSGWIYDHLRPYAEVERFSMMDVPDFPFVNFGPVPHFFIPRADTVS